MSNKEANPRVKINRQALIAGNKELDRALRKEDSDYTHPLVG